MKNPVLLLAFTLPFFLGAGCANGAHPNGLVNTSVPQAATSDDRRLDLHGMRLTSVPKDVFSRTDLVAVDLSGNRLTGALPAEIRRLQSLRSLDASDNAMTGVPAEIGQLKALRFLDLSHNRLTGLPHELSQLTGLEFLDLTGNGISEEDFRIIRSSLQKTRILR